MTHARNLAVLATTLVLVGCGGQTAADGGEDPSTPAAIIEHPTSATDPVVTIDTSGGFVPTTYFLGDIPEVTITGDGTVYLSGQRSTGLVRPVRTADLGEDGIQKVLGWADEAGLLDGSGDHPIDKDKVITDAPTTRVTFVLGDGGTVVEHSAYALGLDETDDDLRQALARFVDDVEQLVADLPTEDYDPTSLVVHALLVKPGGGHVFHPDGVAELELTEGCQVVEDPAAVEALTSGQVPAQDEAGEWTIAARPVLPGDRGCKDPKSTLE